jgi:hypothetical protein
MSPVNEYVEDEPVVVTVPERVSGVIHRATGASDRVSLRVILLFIVVSVCVALAPMPANIVGVAAVVLLALDTSLHRR